MCVVIIINTLLQVSQVWGFEITPFVQVLMFPKATTCFANYCFKKATVVKTEKIKSLVCFSSNNNAENLFFRST